MPLFLIERQFAEALQLDANGVAAIKAVNADVGVNWLFSSCRPIARRTIACMKRPVPTRSGRRPA